MPKTNSEDPGIGRRLKAARERRGWTREALAFHSGVSWSAISQIEIGRRKNARPATLSALSEALGVTIDYLVRGTPSSAMLEHRALLYATDDAFLDVAAPFLAEAVDRSEATLAVTSKGNISLLREHLGSAAEKVEFVESGRWYTTPASTIDSYKQFLNGSLAHGAPWVRIVGEPEWAGKSEAEIRLLTRYESLVNLVFGASPASVLCPYDERSIDPAIVREARITHPETIEAGRISSSPDYADPGEFVLDP